MWRTVKRVMYHMLGGNIGLITPRRVEVAGGWQHAIATNVIVEHVAVSLKTIDYLFPLHLYPDPEKRGVLSQTEKPPEKKPNLDASLLRTLTEAHDRKPTPEEAFHYIYAGLYARAYRKKYLEFLRVDFPRVPFPRSRELFTKVAHLGKRLVDLHLLKSSELDPPFGRFQGAGDTKVEKPRYSRAEKRVYINSTQYFEGVGSELWGYRIGGYQVLEKWLKDRKGRSLNLEEIRHYCRVVTALAKTIEIQDQIDILYPEIEKGILSIERPVDAKGSDRRPSV